MMTELDHLENKVRKSKASDLFGNDVAVSMKKFRIVCHPDQYLNPTDKARAEELFRKIEKMEDELKAPKQFLKSPKRTYTLGKMVAIGDVADIYEATSDGSEYIVKVSRVPEGRVLLENEDRVLREILKSIPSDKEIFLRYFLTPCESWAIKDTVKKRANVFTKEDGFYTLEEVHAKHPVLDGRHLAWIFKRLLTALQVTHAAGYIHGAVLPCHFRVHAVNHGGQLIGFGQSLKATGDVPIKNGCSKYLDWYPWEVREKMNVWFYTDIYMAAKCIDWLGGNPGGPLGRFLKSCMLESPNMRPNDCGQLLEEFSNLLFKIYGPPSYAKLEMES